MGFKRFTQLTNPAWEQQPDESPACYTRFLQYRDQPRGERSHQTVSEKQQRAISTIRSQAYAHRWDERAAAWDSEQTRQHHQVGPESRHETCGADVDAIHERVAARSERLAEEEMAAASEILRWARNSARRAIINEDTLDPREVARWADTAIKLRQAATKAVEHTRAVYRAFESRTSENGDTTQTGWKVEVPELAGLPPDQQRQRVSELVASMDRLSGYEQREQQRGD